MVKPHTSMKIHKVKSTERKGDQQYDMVWDCKNHWYIINNAKYKSYQETMNMKTYRWNDEHNCYVAVTYHLEPNKW